MYKHQDFQKIQISKGKSCNLPLDTFYYDDEMSANATDSTYISINQKLAGPANPKTFIKPFIAPSINNLEYWRSNNTINHSHINTESQNDIYLSGYKVSDDNFTKNSCEHAENKKDIVTELFTQKNQPHVYTINEVIEPIESNIGMSFTQNLKPVSLEKNEKDDKSINEYNIYDPRFTGYGTSYRAYYDDNVGQPRFYYDDINAVKMPTNIVRSNVDFANYTDSYEPKNNNRVFVHDSFLKNSLLQRDELTDRLMRKRNSEMWQLRKYPLNKANF